MDVVNKVVILAGALLWSGFTEARGRDVLAVNEADVNWQSCADSQREAALACHRLIAGDKLVVAMRHRLGSAWGDRGSFQKLTITLPSSTKPGDSYLVDSTQIKAFFSSGSSAFPGKVDCYGFATSGDIVVKRVDTRRVVVRLRATFDQQSSVASRKCTARTVDLKLSGAIKPLAGLSAWEGVRKPGDSPFREANPL